MVNRQNCSKCGGPGRIMVLNEPPLDPQSGEGWEECPHCKGTGVEMAARHFEVYARFPDEVDAREFMEQASERYKLSRYGIRAVEPDDGPLGHWLT